MPAPPAPRRKPFRSNRTYRRLTKIGWLRERQTSFPSLIPFTVRHHDDCLTLAPWPPPPAVRLGPPGPRATTTTALTPPRQPLPVPPCPPRRSPATSSSAASSRRRASSWTTPRGPREDPHHPRPPDLGDVGEASQRLLRPPRRTLIPWSDPTDQDCSETFRTSDANGTKRKAIETRALRFPRPCSH